MGLSPPPRLPRAGPGGNTPRAPLLQSRSAGACGSAPASHQVPASGLRAGEGGEVGRRSPGAHGRGHLGRTGRLKRPGSGDRNKESEKEKEENKIHLKRNQTLKQKG